MKEKIIKIYKDFFDNLGATYSDLVITQKEENIFAIQLQTEESGLLIGQNGKNLDAISHILRIFVKEAFEEKIKVYLEVNDYLQNKDEHLKNFILSKVSIVKQSGKDMKLPFYSAYERRKIHSFVAESGESSIYTKSMGEGRDRRLYICKKEEKLSIDLDSVDI